tara:strand:+ start:514 stop:759 length:246 start_codon:yes stop_codon:yes gene_type:complete
MNFLDNLMTPLNRDHCSLFYYLGLISLLFAVIALFGLVANLFNRKSMSSGAVTSLAMSVLSNLVMYYFARIHYSICLAALN